MQTAELVIYPTKEMEGIVKIPLNLSPIVGPNGLSRKGDIILITIEIGEGLVLYQQSPMR